MDPKNSQKRPDMVFGCIPMNLFADSVAFIHAVRVGIPGHWLASVIQSSGADEAIAKALGVPVAQLEAVCLRDSLDSRSSEAVLELAGVLSACSAVWESPALAEQWMRSEVPALGDETPISLLDTHEGRKWVGEVLSKVETGQFS